VGLGYRELIGYVDANPRYGRSRSQFALNGKLWPWHGLIHMTPACSRYGTGWCWKPWAAKRSMNSTTGWVTNCNAYILRLIEFSY